MEIRVIEQTRNTRKVLVKNPTKEVLAFLEHLEERKRQRKKETLKEKYDRELFIRI